MKAILDLSYPQSLFNYDFSNKAYGMLPFADKPLAAYLIDQLKTQNYETVYILSTHETELTNNSLGDGGFWSIDIKYINLDNSSGIAQYNQLLQSGVKVINPEKNIRIVHQSKQYSTNPTFNSFFDKNISIIESTHYFQLVSYEVKPNLFVCEGAKICNTTDFPIHAGKYSHIHVNCHLSGPCVIGSGSIVEAGTRLDNTVILPNTRVGKNLDLSNCLVTPKWIFHRITQGLIRINETDVLSAA